VRPISGIAFISPVIIKNRQKKTVKMETGQTSQKFRQKNLRHMFFFSEFLLFFMKLRKKQNHKKIIINADCVRMAVYICIFSPPEYLLHRFLKASWMFIRFGDVTRNCCRKTSRDDVNIYIANRGPFLRSLCVNNNQEKIIIIINNNGPGVQ